MNGTQGETVIVQQNGFRQYSGHPYDIGIYVQNAITLQQIRYIHIYIYVYNSKGRLFQVLSGLDQWRTEGGYGVQTPPRNSEDPPKLCQTQPDCENC